ncbi:MAG: hypothetical protein ACFE8Z_00085 [Candidatus Hermodarchaeota archaeon]
MKRHNVLRYAALLAFFMLLLIPIGFVTAQGEATIADDDSTTGEEPENEHEDEHEPEHYTDDDDNVWIQTDILTVKLEDDEPSFEYWYTTDTNGSHAKFEVSYRMIVEFEDSNSDGVYQVNETISFVPLSAFEWSILTGAVTDGLGRNTEVYASYTKGGLSGESEWEDDWLPCCEEEEEDHEHQNGLNFTSYEGMTVQFYSHLYMKDYNGTVTDDEGVKANYTVMGGVELKVDIEIGNFPFVSETSKIAVLTELEEDLAEDSDEHNHHFRLHEDDGDDDHDSEEVMEHVGEEFEERDEDNDGFDDDIQGLSLVESSTDTTRGFYRWLDKAVISFPNGTNVAVDVGASYWTDGEELLLFTAYPNFDGGSLLHDPSMGVIEGFAPSGEMVPLSETAVILIVGGGLLAVAGLVIRLRRS